MDLYDSFMSNENVLLLQNQIAGIVLKKTGIKIPHQSNESMYISMFHVIENYGTFMECGPGGHSKQIMFLNNKFLSIIVPNIMNSMEEYVMYRKRFVDNPGQREVLSYGTHANSQEKTLDAFDYSI